MACLGKFSIETSEMPCSHLCAGKTYYNKDIKLMMKQTAFLYFQDKGLLAQAQIDNCYASETCIKNIKKKNIFLQE